MLIVIALLALILALTAFVMGFKIVGGILLGVVVVLFLVAWLTGRQENPATKLGLQ